MTKQLDIASGSFKANGKEYRVNTKLSIARYEQYEKLQPKLAYGVDFESIFRQNNKIWQLLNDRKFADAAVALYNIQSGIKDLMDGKRIDSALMMCALATLGPDEDPGVYDEQVQLAKIEDWRKEGYAQVDFFLFAASIIKGLPKAYDEFITQMSDEESLKITP